MTTENTCEMHLVRGLSRRDAILSSAAGAAILMAGTHAFAAPSGPKITDKKALIINAHQIYPGISEGRLNRSATLFIGQEMAAKGFEVRETVIEQGYDVAQEVEKTLWADFIVVQSPAFWINTPWIYKKYVDDVFTSAMLSETFLNGDGRPHGQYGSGGKLQGRKFMLSLTMNAPKEAFDNPAQQLFSGRSIDDVFFSASAPYRFCGAEILPAFAFFDVMKNPNVENDFQRLKVKLNEHFG